MQLGISRRVWGLLKLLLVRCHADDPIGCSVTNQTISANFGCTAQRGLQQQETWMGHAQSSEALHQGDPSVHLQHNCKLLHEHYLALSIPSVDRGIKWEQTPLTGAKNNLEFTGLRASLKQSPPAAGPSPQQTRSTQSRLRSLFREHWELHPIHALGNSERSHLHHFAVSHGMSALNCISSSSSHSLHVS